jgi:hypothetical protein
MEASWVRSGLLAPSSWRGRGESPDYSLRRRQARRMGHGASGSRRKKKGRAGENQRRRESSNLGFVGVVASMWCVRGRWRAVDSRLHPTMHEDEEEEADWAGTM